MHIESLLPARSQADPSTATSTPQDWAEFSDGIGAGSTSSSHILRPTAKHKHKGTCLAVTAQRSCSLNAGCRSRDAFGALRAARELREHAPAAPPNMCLAASILAEAGMWANHAKVGTGLQAVGTDTGNQPQRISTSDKRL